MLLFAEERCSRGVGGTLATKQTQGARLKQHKHGCFTGRNTQMNDLQ
jgi:hypothetical protein